MKKFGSWTELLQIKWRKDGFEITSRPNQSTTYTGDRDIQLPPGDTAHVLVSATSIQVLTNKSIDADTNTITNIENADIKALAGIDATKIADGSVDNTEFQALGSAGSPGAGNLVTTDGAQTLSNKTIDGDDNTLTDIALASLKTLIGDANKVLRRDAVGAVISGNLIPNASDLVTTDATQALSGKTIDGDLNTVQDLAIASIKTVPGDADEVFRRDGSGVAVSGPNTIPDNGVLVTESATQTLLAKTLTSPTITGATSTGQNVDFVEYNDQASDPSTPAGAGDVRLYAKDDTLWQIDSNGLVQEVGSGGSGSGGINYIDNPDAETNTDGWATYADAAQATPVDGTGGSPNVTFTRNTTTPLRGAADFLFTKDAANRQGQGVSYDFVIDNADKSRMLAISFDFSGSANYVASDMGVYIYDKDNATLITPSIVNLPQSSGKFQALFSATSADDYRLILHVQSTSALAYTVNLDNFQVGPQQLSATLPMQDWQSFTPTGSFTTNTTYTGKYRRIGSDAEFEVRMAFGGVPNTVSSTINMPTAMTIDTSKLTTAVLNRNVLGRFTTNDNSALQNSTIGVVMYNSTTAVSLYYLDDSNGIIRAVQSESAPFAIAASDDIVATFRVPIAEWAGSQALVAPGQIEYVSNSNTTGLTNDFVSFVYGPNGSLVLTQTGTTGTGVTRKRVRFQTPIQPTDQIYIELYQTAVDKWQRLGEIAEYVDYGFANSTATGIYWGAPAGGTIITATDIDIFWSEGGRKPGATYGGAGANWPASANDRWRVVKIPGTIQAAIPYNLPSSAIVADSGNGHGSSNTNVRRFTNVTVTGTDISYNSGSQATAGAQFTINKAGIYSISYNDDSTGTANVYIGIGRNANGATSVEDLTAATRLALGRTLTTEEVECVSATRRLNAGDVITAHTNAVPNDTSARVQFSITQIVVL